jgi:endoglucanase
MKIDRREFLKGCAALPAAGVLGEAVLGAVEEKAKKSVPGFNLDWHGFNLLDMFTMRSKGDWREDDFKWIRDWGFNFVRLPACYRLWINEGDDYRINESMLEKLDRAVELGGKYGIHVCINFHRGPGYSVNREFTEPFNLWKDKAALDAFCFHWKMLAERYKSIGCEKVSFNLINEPPNPSEDGRMSRADHERVMRAAIKGIREVSPERTVVIDGMSWSRIPAVELNDLNVVHSTRAYIPMIISHYGASWVNSKDYPEPAWPGNGWDKERLREFYKPWGALTKKGIRVHSGEGGVYSRTPHKVVLAWLKDVLEIYTENGIGLALWNFRGSFGVVDSRRRDVEYEDFHGHKLDRKMLDLFIRFRERKL